MLVLLVRLVRLVLISAAAGIEAWGTWGGVDDMGHMGTVTGPATPGCPAVLQTVPMSVLHDCVKCFSQSGGGVVVLFFFFLLLRMKGDDEGVDGKQGWQGWQDIRRFKDGLMRSIYPSDSLFFVVFFFLVCLSLERLLSQPTVVVDKVEVGHHFGHDSVRLGGEGRKKKQAEGEKRVGKRVAGSQ